ncbi:MAG: rhodanese-like domain-containing protein [Salibacteraceae bacterium]
MKNVFFTIIGFVSLLAISCGNTETSVNNAKTTSEQTKLEFSNVSVADLNNAITHKADIIVLDVRTPGELKEGYVAQAFNANVKGAGFSSAVSELDHSKTVYVYCRSGHRSQIASKQLIELGFKDVRNVEGGFLAWASAGFPVAK